MDIATRSILTCPICGAQTEQEMPTDACVFFFECEVCHSLLDVVVTSTLRRP